MTPQDIHSFGAGAVQEINDWVSKQTGSRILEIFNDLGAPDAEKKKPEAPKIDYDTMARDSVILQSPMTVRRPLKFKVKAGFLSY